VSAGLPVSLPEGQPRRGAAITAMLIAAAVFALMSASAKMTGSPGPQFVPAGQVTFFRFLFGAVVMLPLLRKPRVRLLGQDRAGLMWRGFVGGIAVYAYYVALQRTTLTHAVILNFTAVIFGPIFSPIQPRERLTWRSVVAISIAFVGIALIVKPDVSGFRDGDVWGLISGVLSGLAVTAIRRLRRTETASAVFFYFCVVGMAVSAPGCLGGAAIWPAWAAWRLLLVIGVTSVVAQLLMTFGYGHVRTAEGVLIMLSQIVYTTVADLVLFHAPLVPTTALGAACVIGSSVWVAVAARPDAQATRR
jgi:drug/metabolite transporter (DMT)-like permease